MSYLSLQTPVCENFVHSPGLWQHPSKHQCKTDNNQVRPDLGMEGKKKYFNDWHVTSHSAPETTSLCEEHVHACSAKYDHKTDKHVEYTNATATKFYVPVCNRLACPTPYKPIIWLDTHIATKAELFKVLTVGVHSRGGEGKKGPFTFTVLNLQS